MAISWTKEQEQVITLRNSSLLVSAAAGSGKTAVLIQRLIEKITSKDCPLDMDRLLVMTFTRAAAGEMKERLMKALEEEIFRHPEDEHLLRQMNLVHTAQITTIDGFCSWILANYFHRIGLDPGFRVAEEGELRLLREEVVNELLEELFAEKDKDFLFLVECLAPGKNEDNIGILVQKLYDTAMSFPDPEGWLDSCQEAFDLSSREELEKSAWYDLIWEKSVADLEAAGSVTAHALKLCREQGGPYLYEEALKEDVLFWEDLSRMIGERDYDGIFQKVAEWKFPALSRKKMTDVEEEKKERVKSLRDEAKKLFRESFEKTFAGGQEELLRELSLTGVLARQLVKLVKGFRLAFAAAKEEKNLLDFSDMEHFALKILVDEDGKYTQAARELSEKYDEVLIDEYQDSNYVQEHIAQAVAGWAENRSNLFMVGDVKQSIYRFRLACPELFMEKYRSFAGNWSEGAREFRIDLHQNFRSRSQILEAVNFLFAQIMGEDLGGITYDETAALYQGASFPPLDLAWLQPLKRNGDNGTESETDPDGLAPEILIIDKDAPEYEEEAAGKKLRELEALAVAQRIRELEGSFPVLDKQTGGYRPARLGDMAVLLRTASGWSEVFSEVFASRQIASYTASRTGYFSTVEVKTILNYLRILDNPLQDIPLAGVLRSPMVGCTSEELAILRVKKNRGKLYDCIRTYLQESIAEEGQAPELYRKLDDFCSRMDRFRFRAVYTNVHQLIQEILIETGYLYYVSAMPGGPQRSANLQMLSEKAREFERSSYSGLFSFVRYMEHLEKYEVDFGEASLAAEAENSVRIMTIHKSKGLEFPIVFVCGLGKSFNLRDLNESVLIDPDLGLAMDVLDPRLRIKTPGIRKGLIRRKLLSQTLGEELRVLYVALTRAKEKLIMTGSLGNPDKKRQALAELAQEDRELLPLRLRLGARTYWDFILPALARHPCLSPWFLADGILPPAYGHNLYCSHAKFIFRILKPKDLVAEEIQGQSQRELFRQLLDQTKPVDDTVMAKIEERFAYVYPYSYLQQLPVKLSVSELKKRSFQEEEAALELFEDRQVIPLIPEFIEREREGGKKESFAESTEELLTGPQRGTAYHRLMECLDYSQPFVPVKTQLYRLVEERRMTPSQAACIGLEDIQRFLDSPIAERMARAASGGLLRREQPFVFSQKARDLNPEWDTEESILVQGIIDAYFQEGEDLVLVDYKTDRLRKGEEARLIELYRIQLKDYAAALERLTGRRVKEALLYSFSLGKEIPVCLS